VANAATQASSITTLQTQVYANANVAEYLPTYTGNITAGNLTVNNRSVKSTYTVQYLAVGGGGGGGAGYYTGAFYGSAPGGSGGGGGVLTGTTQFTSGLTYTIIVGTGGAGGIWAGNATAGNVTYISEPTSLANIIAYGGGYGGRAGQNGSGGSSGGGGGAGVVPDGTGTVVTTGGTANNYFIGSAYTTQGTSGGTGNKTMDAGAGGGVNVSITIGNVTGTYGTGESTPRAYSGTGNIATVNTGNGGAGGGAINSTNYPGGAGGSGVVYLTYCSSTQLGTGGTIWTYTQNGYTYWMHQFTNSGTYIA
jgi:hypothetical protein